MALSASNLNNKPTALFNSLKSLDMADKKLDGKVNGASIFSNNNKDLQKGYDKLVAAMANNADPSTLEKLKEEFFGNFTSTDRQDNANLDGSVLNKNIQDKQSLNKAKEDITKNSKDFLSTSQIMSILEANDDGKGNVFNNTQLIDDLNLKDDGVINNSMDYFKYLFTSKHPEEKEATDPVKVLSPKEYGSYEGDNTSINKETGKPVNQNYTEPLDTTALVGKSTVEKMIAIAQSNLGANEADGSYTKFGEKGAWCAAFVNYVCKQANDGKDPFTGAAKGSHRVTDYVNWAKDNNRFVQADKAKPGDLITFQWSDGGRHIGIVESIDKDGTIHTIEGNTSDKCARRTYKADNKNILGFVSMGGTK